MTPKKPAAGKPPRKTSKDAREEANNAITRARLDSVKKRKVIAPLQTAKSTGRPWVFNDALATEMCSRLTTRSASDVTSDPDMPSMAALFRWLADPDSKFNILRDMYARASEVRHEHVADEAIVIADTPVEAIMEKHGPMGLELTIKDATEHRRLQFDARKWWLSKVAPHKYGDSTKVALSGSVSLTGLLEGLPTVSRDSTRKD